jgi:hypothetical protein
VKAEEVGLAFYGEGPGRSGLWVGF